MSTHHKTNLISAACQKEIGNKNSESSFKFIHQYTLIDANKNTSGKQQKNHKNAKHTIFYAIIALSEAQVS